MAPRTERELGPARPLPTSAMEQFADPKDRRDRSMHSPERAQKAHGINRPGSLEIAHLRVLIDFTADGRDLRRLNGPPCLRAASTRPAH